MHKPHTGEFLPLFRIDYFRSFVRFALLFIGCISIFSCQSLIRKEACFDNPDSAVKANELISKIRSGNQKISTIKGIGKISLWDSGGIQTSRAAWVGATDGRIRIELLGLPGQPIAKFIYDGKNYYFISPLDPESFRKSPGDSDLKPLTGISISSEDIMLYLSGSIPLSTYDKALFQDGGPQCATILVLTRKWRGIVEKIFLDDSQNQITKVEIYSWGRLSYRVELNQMHMVDGHEIPFLINFSDGNKKGFCIQVANCWPDVPVKPDTFELEPAAMEE